MNWLRNWWWSRQRQMDLQILWPICKEQALNLDHAKAAFMLHAINDPAWVRYYGENLYKAIDALL